MVALMTWTRRALALAALAASVAASRGVRAEEAKPPDVAAGKAPVALSRRYLQIGVAIAAEFVASPGAMCNPTASCILGSGAGIVARGGVRSSGPLYFGFAYEFSKQDPSQLYKLAILQQARVEGRFYFLDTRRDTQPYLLGTAGALAYGNEWNIDTLGPAIGVGIGTETQISTSTVFGFLLTYRAGYLIPFTDSAGTDRPGGFPQMVSLDLVLEGRDRF